MFTYKSTQFNVEGFALVLGASFIGGIRWTLTQMLLQKADLGEPLGRAGSWVNTGQQARPDKTCHVLSCRPPEPHRHHVPPAATHVSGALPSVCHIRRYAQSSPSGTIEQQIQHYLSELSTVLATEVTRVQNSAPPQHLWFGNRQIHRMTRSPETKMQRN